MLWSNDTNIQDFDVVFYSVDFSKVHPRCRLEGLEPRWGHSQRLFRDSFSRKEFGSILAVVAGIDHRVVIDNDAMLASTLPPVGLDRSSIISIVLHRGSDICPAGTTLLDIMFAQEIETGLFVTYMH